MLSALLSNDQTTIKLYLYLPTDIGDFVKLRTYLRSYDDPVFIANVCILDDKAEASKNL